MSEFIGLPSTASTEQPANFAKEEWEDWMKWDGPLDSLSAASPQRSPPPLQYVSGSLGSTSPSEFDCQPPINFSPVYALPTTESKKRKTSASATANGTRTGSGRQPRGKKISHNVIEKRYRSNLNDKIAKLRDSVPELRSAPPTIKRRPQKPVPSDSDGSGDEGSQGLKFNKATVLVKATEYIQQLERQNQRLLAEMSKIRNRTGSKNQLRLPEVITTAIPESLSNPTSLITQPEADAADHAKLGEEGLTGPDPAVMAQAPNKVESLHHDGPAQGHNTPEASSSALGTTISVTPWSEVKGMIPLSESWQRFRAQSRSEEHYAPASPVSRIPELDDLPMDNDDNEGTRWSRSRVMSRVLVGSLAGLMIMEGFSEREEDGSQLKRRGLFSLPNELLTESRGFRSPIRKRIVMFIASGKARQALPVLAFSFVFLFICFAAFVYSIPGKSQAIREVTMEKHSTSEGSESNELDVSQVQSTSRISHRSTSSSHSEPLSVVELYALKLVHWLGLSRFIFQEHDEEAAGRANATLQRQKRWLTYLRVIPKFGEDIQTI